MTAYTAMAEAFSVETLAGLWSEVRAALESHTGMNLSDERESRLVEAFRNFVRENRLASLSAVRAALTDPRRRESALEELVSHLTVGETYFFRNADHFRALARVVLPEVIEFHRRDRAMRIWSAGCSSGEEPYSLAILLDRDFPALRGWDLRILATDISPPFLDKARAARYRAWSFRQTDAHLDTRYFRRCDGDEYILLDRPRELVRFHLLNLVYDLYPSPLSQTTGLDLILFRNVAIYLKDEVTREIIRRFHSCLRPGGWLLLGETEFRRDMFDDALFEPVRDGETTLLRRRDAAVQVPVLPPAPVVTPAPVVAIWAPAPVARPAPPVPAPPVPAEAARETAVSRARRMMAQERLDEAAGAVAEVADRAARAGLELELARLFLNRGAARRADELIAAAVSDEPLLLEAQLLRASLAEETGDLKRMEESLRRALYIDPDCLMAHLLLGMLLSRQGRSESARIFRNALALGEKLEPDAAVPHGEGMCAGRYVQMVRHLQ